MSFSKPLPCHAEEEASVIEWIEANADQFLPRRRNGSPLRKRTKSTKIDYWSTGWGRMLRNPALDNPQSAEAKQFKLRFRFPYLMFILYLLPMCIEKEIFPRKPSWIHTIPAEFKLLGYLVVATAPMISLSFLAAGTPLFPRFSRIL